METIENIIIHFFEKKPEIISLDLFGSYASGLQNERSDVDIAILCYHSLVPSGITLLEWQEEISSLIGKDVDLLCLNKCSPIIGMQVAQNRKTLLLNNPHAYAKYSMHLFSMYAELKELRAPMEKNILKRKVMPDG